MTNKLTELEFSKLADKEINYIADSVERQDKDLEIDVDFAGDVLHFETKFGEYVINKHRVMQQIWLSSPVSGPYHFDYDSQDETWISSKMSEIRKVLSKELSNKTSSQFEF